MQTNFSSQLGVDGQGAYIAQMDSATGLLQSLNLYSGWQNQMVSSMYLAASGGDSVVFSGLYDSGVLCKVFSSGAPVGRPWALLEQQHAVQSDWLRAVSWRVFSFRVQGIA